MIEVGFVCAKETHSSQVKNCMIFLATNCLFKTESHLSQIAIVGIADIFCCYTCMRLYYSYKESSIMLLLSLSCADPGVGSGSQPLNFQKIPSMEVFFNISGCKYVFSPIYALNVLKNALKLNYLCKKVHGHCNLDRL